MSLPISSKLCPTCTVMESSIEIWSRKILSFRMYWSINLGNLQTLWFWVGCLCQRRCQNYLLWNSSICFSLNFERIRVWRQNRCLGFRNHYIRTCIWESSFSHLEPIRYEKNRNSYWYLDKRPSLFPSLGKRIWQNDFSDKSDAL